MENNQGKIHNSNKTKNTSHRKATEDIKTHAGKALTENEREKTIILDSINDLVAYQNTNMDIIWVNKAAAESVGKRPEELIGKKCYTVWNNRHEPCPNCPVLLARVTLRPQSSEISTNDGKHWLVKGYPVLDENSCHTGIVEITSDISEQKKLEEYLRESEERFRLSFEHANSGIYLADLDGNIFHVNEKMVEILGYKRDQLERISVNDLTVPEDKEISTQFIRRCLAGEVENDVSERRFYRDDGNIITCMISSSLVRDSRGDPMYFISQVTDITDSKKSEAELLLRAQILDNASDGICLLNKEAEFVYVNETYCRIHGYIKNELIGKSIRHIDAKADDEWFAWLRQELQQEGSAVFETVHQRKDGGFIYLEVHSTEIESGGMKFNLSVERDITERKEADKKVQELYQKEASLRQQLEAEIEKRIEFTRSLVHELKTPLVPMKASSELLLELATEGNIARLANSINNGTDRLSRRIDMLLDSAKGELGILELNRDEISVVDLLNGLFEDTLPLAVSRNQILRLDLPETLPKVLADEERIRQVIVNFLDNSFKFTPEGGEITIRAFQKEQAIIIEVEDTGIGIPEDRKKDIFQKYQRILRTGRNKSGLGLGLALSKIVVELHGGHIQVTSEEGKGSTFSFSLPL